MVIMNKPLTAKVGAAIIVAALTPGLITYKVAQQGNDQAFIEQLREGATRRGLDPDKVVLLARLEVTLRRDKMKPADWKAFETLSKDPNRTLRQDVYGILVLAHSTSGQQRATELIEESKEDQDKEIRSRYCWNMMLVGAPHWRETCNAEIKSGDSETIALSLDALKRGSELSR